VFHAGDGNLHPNVLFDERNEGETARVLELGAQIMRLCVDAGGSITGEHGVGYEKRSFMEWIFSAEDMAAMARLKAAFGSNELYNPCKLFPTGKGCGEVTQAQVERVMAQVGPDAYV
jgi:glycolate oxidase